MLSIQTNVSAISAQNNLSSTSNSLNTSMERLSSGFRINRAADDAAGLAISEKLKAQIGGLTQASQNAQDGISMIQTAEGALDEVQSMMQRMRDLSVQAASDTNDQSDRANINLELGQLQQEIDSISGTTKFNGQTLLNGSLTSLQNAGTVGYAANTTELAAGTALTTGSAVNVSVASIDVSGSASGLGYTFSADTSGNITMTQVNSLGVTTGQSQTIAASDLANGGTETLNFSKFGVKVNLANTTGSTAVAADIGDAFGSAGTALSVDTGTTSGAAILQTGANEGEQTSVSFVDTRLSGSTSTVMSALNAALNNFSSSVAGTDTTTSRTDAGALITALDNALDYVSSSRATLGAAQNRLQDTISSLGTTSENLSASNSRIVDVDVATESSNMAKEQVLEQAGVSVLAQANQIPQLALKLLQ